MARRSRHLVLALMVPAALAVLTGAKQAPSAEPAQACDAMEVEYALSGNLELSNTPMGKGDGVYKVGPGRAVVRFEQRGGAPSGPAQLVAYSMTERFRIDSTMVFWKTHVMTNAQTTVGNDACGVVSNGVLSGGSLAWTGDIHGSRTDGTIRCEGSLCGKAGAPRAGESPLHVPPHDVRFQPWKFSPDLRTFTMTKTWTAQSESPQQISHITLAGREVRRTCVPRMSCGAR